MRWLVLGRATLGLLRWWLIGLIDLSISAATAREWWLRQRRRPRRHLLWLGPRVWLWHAYGPPPPPPPSASSQRAPSYQLAPRASDLAAYASRDAAKRVCSHGHPPASLRTVTAL
jgi:hypothetical protein